MKRMHGTFNGIPLKSNTILKHAARYPRISIAALTYLTDRVAGKPSQVLKGDPDNAISITLEWTTRPEWLPDVTLNQQVTHIHSVEIEDMERVDGSATAFLDNQKSTP